MDSEVKAVIIWIDGAYGIGKTSVALKVKEGLQDDAVVFLESDCYFQQMMKDIVEEAKKNNCFPAIGGTFPQNNIRFIELFKNEIDERERENKKVLVDMALTQRVCMEKLFCYFVTSKRNILHFILTADEETIKSRIKNDSTRDKQAALDYLGDNISFLNENFSDAIRIKTDNRSTDEISEEIIKIIKSAEKTGHF